MGADRVVQLRWAPRTVVVDDVDKPEMVTYPGIELVRRQGRHVVARAWFPAATETVSPDDDERLIAALAAAWAWSLGAA